MANNDRKSLTLLLPIWEIKIAVKTLSERNPPFFCLLFFTELFFPTTLSCPSLLSLTPLWWLKDSGLLALFLDFIKAAAVLPATMIPEATNRVFLSAHSKSNCKLHIAEAHGICATLTDKKFIVLFVLFTQWRNIFYRHYLTFINMYTTTQVI